MSRECGVQDCELCGLPAFDAFFFPFCGSACALGAMRYDEIKSRPYWMPASWTHEFMMEFFEAAIRLRCAPIDLCRGFMRWHGDDFAEYVRLIDRGLVLAS